MSGEGETGGSVYVDMIAWSDCPHLQPPHVSEQEMADIEARLLPHQREARMTGRPSLGAGAIYPVAESDFVIDPFPIPDFWRQAYGMDVGWRVTAAVFLAHDPENDVYYVKGEYYGSKREPLYHAYSIKEMMPYTLRGAVDPAAEAAGQRDGRKLMSEYKKLGLNLRRANNEVEAGIHKVLILLQTGRLKVFKTCTQWIKEFRLYRRESKTDKDGTERSKIVKADDHLMDGTRYGLNTNGIWTTKTAANGGDIPVKYGEF